jgi:hypothetical protein
MMHSAFAAEITFDDISGNGTIWANDRYLASHEIYFEAVNGPMYAWDDPSPSYGGEYAASSGLTYIYAGGTSSAFGAFEVTFFDNGDLSALGVTDYVQFDVVDYESENLNAWTYYAYDISGNILLSGSGTGSEQTVIISSTSANIHGFRFTPSRDTEALDTFVFNDVVAATQTTPAAVPEPGTLALFGLGLLGIAAIFRNRKIA